MREFNDPGYISMAEIMRRRRVWQPHIFVEGGVYRGRCAFESVDDSQTCNLRAGNAVHHSRVTDRDYIKKRFEIANGG